MDNRILGATWSPSGLTGMVITYDKDEAKGNVRYTNGIKKTIKWAIQDPLLGKLKSLDLFLPDMSLFAQIDKKHKQMLAVECTGWKVKDDFVYLTGIFTGDAGKFATQGFANIPIGPEAGSVYDQLVEAINEIEELVREYATTKADIDERQMALDLFKETGFKGTTEEELESLTDLELLEKAQDIIAKHGGFVMGLEKVEQEKEEVLVN